MSAIFDNILDLLSYHPGETMFFSNGIFWALFIVFMPIYALLRNRRWQMITFVVLFSLFFYYKSNGWAIIMLAGTSVIDWMMSRVLVRHENKAIRKACVWVSILCSVGILIYFKYTNFLLESWSTITGSNFSPLAIGVPVGLSFYTFRSISYIVDVYKGKVPPTKSLLEYVFFLTFFPAILMGPITRAADFLPQIRLSKHATKNEIYFGLWLIILGVIKDAIIAQYLATYNNMALDIENIQLYSGFETMMGILGYTLQIYCDFSGYSDMAIGIAMIMGFKIAKNFNFPYKSTNLTEFWRRWHISLSTWLRDYIYIPLGGNRKGKAITYLNNFTTMVIGGIWHGAGLNYIIWGAMHGGGLAVHKFSKPYLDKQPWTSIWPMKIFFWLVTFFFVMFLWVFFKVQNACDAWTIIHHSVTDFSWDYAAPFAAARTLWLILLGVIFIAHFMPEGFWDKAGNFFVRTPWIVKLLLFIVVIQLIFEIQAGETVANIYAQY